MTRHITILSYFSLPTDLAGEMSDWPEFVSGEGYAVNLKDTVTGALVTVKLIEEDGQAYVVVDAPVPSSLFDRVIGRVIYALAADSDNLMVDRR
jgi:hypothetical protein